jgi:hypothetical protein
MDFVILDDGDAHSRHARPLHQLGEGEAIEALPVGHLRPFDFRHDARDVRGLSIDARRAR